MRLGAFFFEIMPLAGFFIGFHYYGLFIAAVISVGLAGMVLGLAWWRARYVARFRCFHWCCRPVYRGGVLLTRPFSSKFSRPFSTVFLRLYCLVVW